MDDAQFEKIYTDSRDTVLKQLSSTKPLIKIQKQYCYLSTTVSEFLVVST